MGYGNRSGPEYYGNSARLEPLAETTRDEIRVWVSVLSSVRGTVVTKDSYMEFSNWNSSRLKLVPTSKHQSNGRIFKHLPALALLSKYTYDCAEDIHGGQFFHIEGVYQGKSFSTYAHMPSSECTGPGYNELNSFLQDAGYQKAP
jgi:hypothetical protein